MTSADPPPRCRHRWHAGQIHTCWQPPDHADDQRCRRGATTTRPTEEDQ